MMLWFKHDTDANGDAKLKRLRMKYGLEGYGLYWYCLELIAGSIDKDNLTFELEHDAEIISFDTNIHYERVQEMMTYMVSLGLFEQDQGAITCLKLAKRLDKSMTNSPKMRDMIENVRKRHDIVSERHPRIEENRVEKNKKEVIKKKPSELNWGDIQLTDQQKNDIKTIRAACKKKLTQLALNPILKELDMAKMNGIDYQESIDIWAMRGWVAFKAEWAMNHKGQNNGKSFGNTATLTNLGDTDF